MRTAFRTTFSLSILALAAVVSATAVFAGPVGNDSTCPDCALVGGKGNLTGEAMGHEDAESPVSGNPSMGAPAQKVAEAAPAANDGPHNAPDDGPLVAVDDAGPVKQPGDDKVAEAAPAQDVDQDDAPDGPSKVKQKKAGPNDDHNARGDHEGARHSGGNGDSGGGNGGGHNADGSPR